MDRIFIIREWLRRELAAVGDDGGAYASLLQELLAVVDRNTINNGNI